MKTRLGFVSNSSSSSFVIVIEKEAYERKLAEVHPYVRAVVKAMEKKKDTFMGHDVVVIGTWSDAAGGSNFEELDVKYDGGILYDDYGDEMRPHEAYENFGGFPDNKHTYMSISDG